MKSACGVVLPYYLENFSTQHLIVMNKVIAAELLEAHRQELVRFITRRGCCEDTASDIVQDCFLRFTDYLKEKTVQNPRAFLFRMVANQATDYLRQQNRFSAHLDDLAEFPDLVDQAPSVEDIVDGQARMKRLKQALAELPSNHREIFILRNIKHHSYAEITEQTGLSYNTIFKYLNEALLHCRKKLQD
jgi:RNA polymerase sigma factor (sigma-70 family)